MKMTKNTTNIKLIRKFFAPPKVSLQEMRAVKDQWQELGDLVREHYEEVGYPDAPPTSN